MKKIVMSSIVAVVCLLLISCSQRVGQVNEIWSIETVEAYMTENNLVAIYYETDNERVIAITQSSSGYGLILVEKDEGSGEIRRYDGTISHEADLVIGQIHHEQVRYTAAYIVDPAMRAEAAMAIIHFEDLAEDSGPFKIQKTLNGLDGFMLTQDLENHKKAIESISLLDEKKYELLTINK